MKKKLQRLLALTLICLMLLAGCGKNTAPAGSAETAAETAQATKKDDKKDNQKDNKKDDSAKESPAPTDSAVAVTPTPDPVQAATDVQDGADGQWKDVEDAQEDVMENLAVSPTGNWNDPNTGAAMVIDGAGSASILWTQGDGSVYVWQFTITQDADGSIHYKDCVKLIQSGNQPPRVLYQNGTGSLAIKGGSLYWQDDIEDAGDRCVFQKES